MKAYPKTKAELRARAIAEEPDMETIYAEDIKADPILRRALRECETKEDRLQVCESLIMPWI